jgi:hypothetical protein
VIAVALGLSRVRREPGYAAASRAA